MALFLRCWFILLAFQAVVRTSAEAQDRPLRLTFDVLPGERLPVTEVLQDRTGFLWIGSIIGLYRYDGYELRVFRHAVGDSSSLAGNYINTNALAEAPDGRLWIGARTGLSRFDPAIERFENFHQDVGDPASLAHDNVNHVLVTRAGDIWAGTNLGLDRYDPAIDGFAHYRHDPDDANSIAADTVTSLAEDAAGRIWIGTVRGLSRLDPSTGEIERYALPQTGYPWSLRVDSRDVLWVGTARGVVHRLDPSDGALETVNLFRDFGITDQGGFVMDLFEDESGRIWAGAWNGGLFVFDGESWNRWFHEPDEPYSLPENSVSEFFVDRSGKMWVGTWSGLAHVRSEKDFDHLDLSDFTDAGATSVDVDAEGRIWVGTAGGGVWSRSENTGEITVLNTRTTPPLSVNEVSSVVADRAGRIWIGTSGGGVNRYDPETGRMTYFTSRAGDATSLPDNLIYKIFEDRSGRIWIGTVQAGLALWDEENERFWTYRAQPEEPDALASNEVWTIYQGGDERIWLGAIGGGLHEVLVNENHERIRFRRYGREVGGAVSQDVVALFQDEEGAIWAGAIGQGLHRIDPSTGTVTRFGVEHGLPNEYVGCILPGNDSNLWIGTRGGLARLDRANERITAYTEADGLKSHVFFLDGCDRDPSGNLYFASEAGVTVVNATAITDNPTPPPVALTEVYLFNAPLRMDSSATHKRVLRLPYDRNFISFAFSGLDFNLPPKNRYAYRLEGLDAGWVETGTGRRADYPNLLPREYTFYARAANNDGIWSREKALMTLVIEPPFWDRWWFRLLSVGVVAAIIATIYRNRRERKRELEHTRQQIADDLHDDIGSKLSAVRLFLSRIQSKDRLGANDRRRMESYSHALERMTSDLRDVVWLADPEFDTLASLCERMADFARKLDGGLDLEVDIDGIADDVQLKMNVRRHLFYMVKESLHNAVKHAGATRIVLKVRYEKPALRIRIEDDGQGFDPSSARMGQGLRSIPRRAGEIDAELTMASEPGRGTTVVIVLAI